MSLLEKRTHRDPEEGEDTPSKKQKGEQGGKITAKAPCVCTVALQEASPTLVYVPTAAPLTLHADEQPSGGNWNWAAADPTVAQVVGVGDTATVTVLQAGATDITVTYTCPGGQQAQAGIRLIAFNVAIDHPSGDPVNAPGITNEFTFGNAAPGVLTIQCRALVTPNTAEVRNAVAPLLLWNIGAVGASTLAWSVADPTSATQGSGLNTTATFTGLPARNQDFGSKTVTLTITGPGNNAQRTTGIEVFFPKNATNHPNPGQGVTPNWFFYWMDVINNPAHVRYDPNANGDLGETRGMTEWSYAAVPDKTLVHVFDDASRADGAIAGLHGALSGIDLFNNTVLHESEHAAQIARADPVVGIHPNTCWRFGWSWNHANHNHWQLAPGRVAGAAGICLANGPGTMGTGGDILIEELNPPQAKYAPSDWPSVWGAIPPGALPNGDYIGDCPIEQQAYQAEPGVEHALARQDWGDPGKNHRTVDRYDD